MGDFFHRLATLYKEGSIEIHLIYNGIDYDKNFSYNPKKDTLFAESSTAQGESFGGDGNTISHYIKEGLISINIRKC